LHRIRIVQPCQHVFDPSERHGREEFHLRAADMLPLGFSGDPVNPEADKSIKKAVVGVNSWPIGRALCSSAISWRGSTTRSGSGPGPRNMRADIWRNRSHSEWS
jgi:hypothetical protein